MPNRAGTKGILYPISRDERFAFARHPPSSDLAFWIDWYWIVRWDLAGQEPRTQETIPHPSVNLVFEKDASGVFGVATRKFTRVLADAGLVFGIKFRPGAFHSFTASPVSDLTDSSRAVLEDFGVDDRVLETEVLTAESDTAMIDVVERFLRAHTPEKDNTVVTVNSVVDYIVAHREVTRVEELARQFGMSTRMLQRLFSRCVGVSPKWVIRRYRLQEAAEQLSGGAVADWSGLALNLGYFDQAHFINDFRSLIGLSPAEYARRARSKIQ
ncbi:MAG: AraC family transcriptional regulator [Gemmatimonadaceae bacterium]